MHQGDAASEDEGDSAELLLPEDVAAAPQATLRRPKAPALVEVNIVRQLAPDSNSQPASDPYLGKVVAERYQVERLLGVGSMGLVYRCRHTVLDKTVALKIIRQDLAQDDETVGRFVTEAKAASAIGSKHIVEVLDFGKLPDGATYIVMEYLEGLTLGEAIDGPSGISLGDAIDIGIQIAEALGAAHAVGVVHRDMKPDNVFLLHTEEGFFVKVLDFGIAKILHSGQKLTVAGSVIGTPHYMSPEQATGARTDETTDIYSLGVMLYEMACGKVPFDAESPLAVISMQVTDDPPPLRKRMPAGKVLPQGLESVIHKCLAKQSIDRFANMQDVRAALERIAGGGVPLVAPPSSRDAATDSMIDELVRDTDYRELRAAGRRRKWFKRSAFTLFFTGLTAASAFGAHRWIKLRAAEFEADADRRAEARLAEHVAQQAPPPAPAPVESASAAAPAPAPETIKVALIMFPLDARALDGEKDLGMMPVLIEVTPGETKTISIVRRGFVTRALRVDGKKTRLVVGLVSNAVAAKRKHKGLSQEEAEAEADRVAENTAGVDTPAEEGSGAPRVEKPVVAAKGETGGKQAKTEAVEKPVPKPAARGDAKTTLAPNPFGD